ncbi:Malto-oligosyltrehalose trehalohydrolase [Usitatibacter rugosus]|uniref:Malto-oligosyltrehalose trehalohydrolase n=2 Tax=Usitatibacter rugosus TaxID=2732067 RepID=A0A6M4GVX5_9PROT|nr:Malto-oligosyltrehalose trehalohydrolase [Usitatibacter rugosus]
MPFGAEVAQDGVVRFRLWAPAAERVSVAFPAEPERHALDMRRFEDGWFEARRSGIPAGTRYAYRIDGRDPVPDPASRFNPADALGPSALVDPRTFTWTDGDWAGRPWHEAVVYELHIGTFTPSGTFRGAMDRLGALADLGVTAIEVMPVADFPGMRNWGYDGVLPFAPDAAYGTPDDFKAFVCAAHRLGLMVLLDVVYNHFGPEGNHLAQYAPGFFNAEHETPWGAAINYDAEGSRPVRDFFVHNALYWVEEFHLDGLRLDAVHAIVDDSPTHLLSEIATALAEGPGTRRYVHLVLENDRNESRWLANGPTMPCPASAQWNDDFHHAMHVLVTGECEGYYGDYADDPARHLARSLAEGFAYQGEASPHRKGERRGERSAHLRPTAFVNFLQDHDQVGNRAMGERLAQLAQPEALRLAVATLLLAPAIPMLFMGEEFAAGSPFLYFCDYRGALADAVREGRRREFAAFERFADPQARERIPDPNAPGTFRMSHLDWSEIDTPPHAEWLALHRELLSLRRLAIVPHLAAPGARGTYRTLARGVAVDWTFGNGTLLSMRANFSDSPLGGMPPVSGSPLFETGPGVQPEALPPWGGVWTIG